MLEQAVESIVETQHSNNYEIVIVDQSDSYNVFEEEERIKKIINDKSILKYCAVMFKNLPKARNYGINVSKGTILLFLDDDMILYPNLFNEHIKSHQVLDAIGCVAGQLIEEPDIFTNMKSAGAIVTFTGRCLRNFSSRQSGYIKAAPGGNMSIKKEIIPKVGFFDERFFGTSELEETDYCYRMVEHGFKIFFNPNAKVKHLISRTGGCRADFSIRQYYRMHNLGLFFAKHKNVLILPILLLCQMMTIVVKTFKQSTTQRIQICFDSFRGLLVGYFISSKRKHIPN